MQGTKKEEEMASHLDRKQKNARFFYSNEVCICRVDVLLAK